MGLDKQQFGNSAADGAVVKDLLEIRAMVKDMAHDLNGLFRAIIEHSTTFRTPRSIVEMAKLYEGPCDLLIVNGKRDEGLEFASGKLEIAWVDSGNFTCAATLYFQNQAGKWLVKKASSEKLPASHLTDDAWTEVMKKGTIAFEIFDPEQD